jgi:hypothetical protein
MLSEFAYIVKNFILILCNTQNEVVSLDMSKVRLVNSFNLLHVRVWKER